MTLPETQERVRNHAEAASQYAWRCDRPVPLDELRLMAELAQAHAAAASALMTAWYFEQDGEVL